MSGSASQRLKMYRDHVDVEFLAWASPTQLKDNSEYLAKLALIANRLDVLIEREIRYERSFR